ncbi:MAG: RluA family pseudouridine synthase [Clostridiaceae bacterium]|nr:RluA family pseudouridine synthase [Clostridiaceae bacterium]
MREYTIRINDANQRLDSFLSKACPGLGASLIQKLVRQKRVKVNGKRAEPSQRLTEGDLVNVYVYEERLAEYTEKREADAPPEINVVYEDENILLADKPQGMLTHPDDEGRETDTLIGRIQSYLKAKGEWDPETENAFAPSLCNRIDRNTGGIVIAAKNAQSLREMNEHIRNREVEKRYLCVVHGRMEKRQGRLENFLRRDMREKRVFVENSLREDARTAITEYRVIAERGELSLLECRLITGRTHQIRAQLAAVGHPLLGDGKYGTNAQNRMYGKTWQALYSYRTSFRFQNSEGALGYLKGRSFCVKEVPLAAEFGVRITEKGVEFVTG